MVNLRTFKAGDLVLFKTPGMNNKLCDAWQGPFRVRKRLGKVNYEIEKDDVGKKKLRVVRVNNIKLYEEQVRVQRIVVVTEEYSECVREKIKLAGRDLDDKAMSELETVLSKYKDMFSDSSGHTKVMTHSIVTEPDIPVTSQPYRLCPLWKDKVKAEIELLLQAGIVCDSTSAWSSPIVPVRKPAR